jgi:hypothetical protein
MLVLSVLSPARAEGPADPLGLVPEQAELVFKVEEPRKIADIIAGLDVVQDLQKVAYVRELFDTTKARRFFQLLAYFEKELGHPRLDLLDRLAGGGIVVAAKFTGSAAALIVIQARDEQLLKKFVKLGTDVIDQELARQEAKERPRKSSYRDVDVAQIDKLHYAVIGAALVAGTDAKVVHAAIDCFKQTGTSIAGSESLAEARKHLAPEPLAWLWVDLAKVRGIPGFKDGIGNLDLFPPSFFILGAVLDVIKRAPYLSVGFHHKGNEAWASLRMPRGREGMSKRAALLLPEDSRGTLPLLQPANTLASFSYYIDLSKLYENKSEWIKGDELKALEKLEKNSGRFLAGIKIGTLLKQAGTHHRVVVTQTPQTTYKTVPEQPFVPFAVVLDMREPAFGKSMETLLRGAGVIASLQFNLKMVEEKRGPYTIVSYRFPEDGKVPGDVSNVRFSFSPCFAAVGDQFIVSSTVELGRELVDLVSKEKNPPSGAATARFQLMASGSAAALRAAQDQLRTQIILSQAVNPKEAQVQVQQIIRLVERLGVLSIETNYGTHEFRYDFKLVLGSK